MSSPVSVSLSETIVHTTESGIESNSIDPERRVVSLVDKPFSKSNPMMAGSSDSALTSGVITNNGANSNNVASIGLNLMVLWQNLMVMKPMHS